ncbi:hypothetical protein O7626_29485 [Micromonospora sp. WMMD1102]|uniref:hypothetical protein n=1 Tax=Micromonospora sp. WMMD1102 TaxID=3016105 RepID=UPI0024153B47|nr:hypothetical protein [Micromonospora sp. WMMD1102]MDG4790007.1 hypothetical protein [Micromonospora sp. WMMD1102]
MYRYFIAYVFSTYQGSGNGWTEVTRDAPIRSSADVLSMTNLIANQDKSIDRLTITGWQRFED